MKTTDEILEEMRSSYIESTGYDISDSSDLMVRMTAIASQINALYIYNDWIKQQCFPQTASGDCLDKHAEMRGIARQAAVASEGNIRFLIPEVLNTALTVPAGTVCMTAAGTRFATEKEAVIEAGALYCDVPAVCTSAGISGNVSAGTVVYMASPPVGVSSCINIDAFVGGDDAEDDESLRERIMATYAKLPNGTNCAYYETEVLNVEGVEAVKVLPKVRGIGTVDIVFSATGGVPSEELIQSVAAMLDEKREICVDISVQAPETVTVNVAVEVVPQEGCAAETVCQDVAKALRGYFDGKLLGKSVTLAELGNIIYGVTGTANYRITAPAKDVGIEPDQLPVLGTVEVALWS